MENQEILERVKNNLQKEIDYNERHLNLMRDQESPEWIKVREERIDTFKHVQIMIDNVENIVKNRTSNGLDWIKWHDSVKFINGVSITKFYEKDGVYTRYYIILPVWNVNGELVSKFKAFAHAESFNSEQSNDLQENKDIMKKLIEVKDKFPEGFEKLEGRQKTGNNVIILE